MGTARDRTDEPMLQRRHFYQRVPLSASPKGTSVVIAQRCWLIWPLVIRLEKTQPKEAGATTDSMEASKPRDLQ